MRFIHAADLHIDSPLRGLEQYEGAPVDEIRGATRRAFDRLVELAVEREVDALLLSGDVFDGDWRDYNTGLFFASRMVVLREANVRVVMIRGNHDAQSRISRYLSLPDNVRELDANAPETILFEDLGLAVHGQSYDRPEVTEDLSAAFSDPISGMLNVGMLHTSLDGREGHAPYAPTKAEILASKGYDYWALGHVHQREIVSTDPWIVFPGNLQGRHAKEVGPKGCMLVTAEGPGRGLEVEPIDLDVVRWAHLRIDASALATAEEIVDSVRRELEAETQRAEDRLLAARVTVEGATDAHHELSRDPDRWTHELRLAGSLVGGGRVWIEKVRLGTRASVDLDKLKRRNDPLGELFSWIDEIRGDESLQGELLDELATLSRKLPRALAVQGDVLRLDDPESVKALLPDVEQLLLSKLLSSEEQ